MAGAAAQRPEKMWGKTGHKTFLHKMRRFFDDFRQKLYNRIVKVDVGSTFAYALLPDADQGRRFVLLNRLFPDAGLTLRKMGIIAVGGEAL